MAVLGIEGTEDWIEVVSESDDSLCYEWDEFHAYYSPSVGKYHYASDRGCSCDYFGDYYTSVSDFQVGDLADVVRSLLDWNRGYDSKAKTSLDTPIEIKREIRAAIQAGQGGGF
jgi:hypothetical protein